MTCNERLEILLNRAGQTFDESRDYTHDETMSAMSMPFLELVMKYLECVRLIDTMETALENVCGERDYLRRLFKQEMPCRVCGVSPFEYDGVPEDWSVDDDTDRENP